MDYGTLFVKYEGPPGSYDESGPPLTDGIVAAAEAKLGYKLPASYLAVLRTRNGGYLTKTRFPTNVPTSRADDHIPFDQVFGVGGDNGIDSETGSQYLVDEWGYPDCGVVIASDGHTAVMLDYRLCGPTGEPRVIWVDVESYEPPQEVILAPNFEAFVNGLQEEGPSEYELEPFEEATEPDNLAPTPEAKKPWWKFGR